MQLSGDDIENILERHKAIYPGDGVKSAVMDRDRGTIILEWDSGPAETWIRHGGGWLIENQ